MVRWEGNMSLKNPVTPPGIDPGTVRLVAQRLNHYATPGHSQNMYLLKNAVKLFITILLEKEPVFWKKKKFIRIRAWGSVVVKALRY